MTIKDFTILLYILISLISLVTSAINFFEGNIAAGLASLNAAIAWATAIWFYIGQDGGIR